MRIMDDGKKKITYSIAEKALREWSKDRLELMDADEGVRHYRFRYTGSTCTNGGTPFNAYLHVLLSGRLESAVIDKAWTIIPKEEREAALAMCTAYRDFQGEVALFEKLTQSADFSGRSLEEVLTEIQEDRSRLNYAGCFCGEAMVREKWNQVLSTVHWREHHGSAEKEEAIPGPRVRSRASEEVPQ